MDHHDGTGTPGKDEEKAGRAQPSGGRRPATKPAVKPRRPPARSGEQAEAPAPGGAGPSGTTPAGPVTAGPAAVAADQGRAAPTPAGGKGGAPRKRTRSVPAAGAKASPAGAGSARARAPQGRDAAGSGSAEAGGTSGKRAGRTAAAAATSAAEVADAKPGGQEGPGDGRDAAGSVAEGGVSGGAGAGKGAAAGAGSAASGVKPAKRAGASRKARTAEAGADAAGPPAAASHAASASAAKPGGQEAARDSGWRAPGYLHEEDPATGGSGRAVRARREADGTPVALTYLPAALEGDPAFREVFESEAEVLGGLDSPYLARVHAYVQDGRHAAIVGEAVGGVGLDAVLRAGGPTAPEGALAVLKGTLLGLAAAHSAGVLHRGLRPADLLITPDGAVKVTGFGLVPRGADDSGPIPATSSFTAPERRAGGPARVAGDLYAATACFHECLVGVPPNASTGPAQAPASQHAVPEPVRPLTARGTAPEPALRPSSAAGFAAELDALAAAAYGGGWEERGRRELAMRADALTEASGGTRPAAAADTGDRQGAAPVPGPAGPAAAGVLAADDAAHDEGRRKSRFGRHPKILAAAVAGVIVAGAIAIAAAASGKDSGTAAANTGPAGSTPRAQAPVAPSPTATTTTASATARPSASRTAAATTAGTPGRTAPATTAPAGSGPAAAPTTPPGSPASTAPPRPAGSAAGPHVSSLSFTGFQCSNGKHRTATATVFVRYDGTAAGTLHLTWWRSATRTPQGAVTMAPQTARFPKGARSYTFTDSFTFTTDRQHPYIGLTVSSDPAADSGNGSFEVGCH